MVEKPHTWCRILLNPLYDRFFKGLPALFAGQKETPRIGGKSERRPFHPVPAYSTKYVDRGNRGSISNDM